MDKKYFSGANGENIFEVYFNFLYYSLGVMTANNMANIFAVDFISKIVSCVQMLVSFIYIVIIISNHSKIGQQINKKAMEQELKSEELEDEIKKKCNKSKKEKEKRCKVLDFFHSDWFLRGIIIIILGAILFFLIPVIQENYVGGILTFVGILATFIVVSNYAQVQEVKKESKRELEKSKEGLEQKFMSHTKDVEGKLASLVHYVNAVRYEQMKNVFKGYDLSATIFDCYISAMACLSDVSNIETKTINPLLSGISQIIDCTDAQSIVKNYRKVNIKKNNSCISLLRKIDGDDKIIKFIKDVNEIAKEKGIDIYEDYEYS
jgi:hypothetical protein